MAWAMPFFFVDAGREHPSRLVVPAMAGRSQEGTLLFKVQNGLEAVIHRLSSANKFTLLVGLPAKEL
jgi:hypothetical protein